MGSGSKRNKDCWCGSGKKYKNCHLNREKQEPHQLSEVFANHRKAFGKKTCLHPNAGVECSGAPISAHTVQRNGGLSRIAKEGHVYSWSDIMGQIVRTKGKNVVPKLIGTKNATTFFGFCSKHDSETFAPVETVAFESSPEQIFLLGFRALAKELYAKEGHQAALTRARDYDAGRGPLEQFAHQQHLGSHLEGGDLGLRDLLVHKTEYDAVLMSHQHDRVRGYVIRLDETPDVLCAGAIFPECDFSGAKLQDLSDESLTLDLISLAIIPTDTGGAVVFSWLSEQPSSEQLMRSLDAVPEEALPAAIVRFVFEFLENVAISPNWWDGLGTSTKNALVSRAHTGMNPSNPRTMGCLKDDSLRPVKWNVVERLKVNW